MMRTRLLRLLLGASALGLLSCKEATGNDNTAYSLTSVAGLSLPAAYSPNQQQDARIMSAVMVLYTGGKGAWYGRTEQTYNGATYDWDQEFTWTQSGFDISITLDCDDTASCIAGPHMTGTVQLGRLTFTSSNVMRTPFVFETAASQGR